MSLTFVDTLYFIASINPRDQWHQKALEVGATLKGDLVTTEAVLIELLNFFCAYGPEMRVKCAAVVDDSLPGHRANARLILIGIEFVQCAPK